MSTDLDWPARGKSDGSGLSGRKACPACGRRMKVVSDEAREGRSRYFCTNCDDDPLHDPAALKWADVLFARRRNERDPPTTAIIECPGAGEPLRGCWFRSELSGRKRSSGSSVNSAKRACAWFSRL